MSRVLHMPATFEPESEPAAPFDCGSRDADVWIEAAAVVRKLPVYRELYGSRLLSFGFDESLSQLPCLERATLARAFPAGWMTARLRAAIAASNVEFATTSGSSGERLQIVRPRGWWPAEHRRSFAHVPALAGFAVGRGAKAVLAPVECSSSSCRIPSSAPEERLVDNVLYLNVRRDPNDWTRGDLERMVSEIDAHRPELLDADPSYLCLLLDACRRLDVSLPAHRPAAVSLDYTMVTGWAMRRIRHAFGVPVVNLYGTTELGCLFAAEATGLRRCPELSHVELLPFCPRRSTYELVVTCVKNPYMPFVRYRVGDVVKLDAGAVPDAHHAHAVCGRAKDALPAANGDVVTAGELDEALAPCESDVLLYQVAAAGPRSLAFRYTTPDDIPLTATEARAIVAAFATHLGRKVHVALVHVRQIAVARSGKFALVKPGAAR